MRRALWQISRSHQEAVAFARGAAAFVERPHHEALAATGISTLSTLVGIKIFRSRFELREAVRRHVLQGHSGLVTK